MRIRPIALLVLASLALLLAAGCERGDDQAIMAEADEPNFRQGQQLVKQGRSQEALSAYLKVISKRGDSAPESHLEAGLLYLQQIKDPLAAIYHFRKYLELQPNARQAVFVKGRIDVAKREFARTLPAQPLESQTERLDSLDQIGRLQRENDQLRAELSALRSGVPTATRSRITLNRDAVAARAEAADDAPLSGAPFLNQQPVSPLIEESDSPVSLAPETVEEEFSGSPVVQSAPLPPGGRAAPTKPTAPAAAGRRHVVIKGDTLFSLAQKYYGNRSKWRDIYAVNRDVLPSENALRIGMELKIP